MFRPLPFAVVVALMAGALAGSGIPKLYALSERGVKTTGKVVQTHCENHGAFKVRIEVNGKPFDVGAGGAGVLCSDLHGGEAVTIYYLPEDPNVTSGADPRGALHEAVAWAVLFGIVLGLASYFFSGIRTNAS